MGVRPALWPYLKWRIGQSHFLQRRRHLNERSLPPVLAAHAEFAAAALQHERLEVSEVLFTHQLRLADRQCRMAEQSQRVQDLVVILVTSLWASRQSSAVVQAAADILCQDLTRRITGKRPSDAYFRAATKLGQTIASGGFELIAGIEAEEILMPYDG